MVAYTPNPGPVAASSPEVAPTSIDFPTPAQAPADLVALLLLSRTYSYPYSCFCCYFSCYSSSCQGLVEFDLKLSGYLSSKNFGGWAFYLQVAQLNLKYNLCFLTGLT